ncbi:MULTISPECIES: cytochrome f [Cyanophyceae]|uniref:cytochrome f n=1 Tax=Cyanophyceae TaxID=3028117 RepID=UPI0016898935|nr:MULTISPECIES: apocytochrome f [Cyanophyceae]MBD1914501.1 apocytochrome f [Phormidium sp. FACHB-77]MBD2031074.1 apocytochrome f [Phormidium sp. FACHB-322]MBD2052093.1 apocytochrome f [Leptolyngbya sp. FACHB-60]
MNRLTSLINGLRPLAITCAAVLTVFAGWLAVPQAAEAYPFWAQENYAVPREATGRIVCANCHLAAKPTKVEVPQAVLPDSVFKLKVEIPYDLSTQQVLGDGSRGGLNVGAVVVLPEGFKIAPADRISEELKEEVGNTYFLPYSDTQENIVLVGPLPGEQYQEIVFPVLAPDPGQDKSVAFGKYQIHVGGNRGRGQVYPTGQASNNTVYNATVTGTVTDVEPQAAGGYQVTIQADAGNTVTETIPAGPELLVAEGDAVEAGKPLTTNPNVGGFGQMDAEIVLQSPNRIKGLVAFVAAVMLTQIMLVLKKKQVEKVQAAGMTM